MVSTPEPYAIENPAGRFPAVIVVDHATNHLPATYGTLGLSADALLSHIAWDPGAIEVARALAARLDAPLIRTTVSRLVLDVNRPETSATLIPTLSETTVIPGNLDLPAAERQRRIERFHGPYHAAVAALVADKARRAPPGGLAVIAIHTFTPVFKGVVRPLHAGVLFGADDRFGRPLLAALAEEEGLVVEENQPYSPADEVYTTLDRHAVAHGHGNVMIEIRNDLVRSEDTQQRWADRLAAATTRTMGTATGKTGTVG